MSNYDGIVHEIARKIARVKGTGIVHTYRRFADDDPKLKDILRDNKTSSLRGWMISREIIEVEQAANNKNTRISSYSLRYYHSFSDNGISEHEFQKIIDNVMDEFSPQSFLSLKDFCELIYPIEFQQIGFVDVGGHICHLALGVLRVQEYGTF